MPVTDNPNTTHDRHFVRRNMSNNVHKQEYARIAGIPRPELRCAPRIQGSSLPSQWICDLTETHYIRYFSAFSSLYLPEPCLLAGDQDLKSPFAAVPHHCTQEQKVLV
jgi:hypothetical protein